MARDAQAAIAGGDQLLTAKLVHFPLKVYEAKRHFTINDSAELQKDWSQVFSPTLVAKIQKGSPHEMFVHDGEAMLRDGELWFDDKGITAVNDIPEPDLTDNTESDPFISHSVATLLVR